MTITVRGVQTEDHDKIIAIAQELAAWFDDDARIRAIPFQKADLIKRVFARQHYINHIDYSLQCR